MTYRRGGVLVVVVVGSIKTGTINATNAHAAHPIGRLKRPRFHGPGRKRFPTKNTRMKIGIVKATKAATAPMEKRAPAGTGPAKIRRERAMPMAVLNHTALTGVLVCWFTRLIQDENGRQSSRAYAKVTREEATYKTQICQIGVPWHISLMRRAC